MNQLQTNLTNLQAILNSVNNLPDAMTLPTCTVNITSGDATITLVAFTRVDTTTGDITSAYVNISTDTISFQNVLCGSIMTVVAKDVSTITANDNCELFFATASSTNDINGTVKITASNDEIANIVFT